MKLFIPGPVTVRPDILEKMSTPMIGHRSKEASELQRSISLKMQKLWNTNDAILLSTSSGSGLMEGAIRSCTKERAAIFSIGAFGNRWYQMAEQNGLNADLFEDEKGEISKPEKVEEVLSTGKYDLITLTHNETSTGVQNPIYEIAEVVKRYPEVIFCIDTVSSTGGVDIDIEKLGADIVLTSTQKCLGLPPGLAICTFSDKAIAKAREVENRGFYLDLLAIYEYILKKDFQYPSTPSISHMYALDYQLSYILEVEGKVERYKRHKQMAELVRNWAKTNFQLFTDEKISSDTVTCISNNKGIDVKALNENLKARGMQISNGYGDLKEKTFRIAHMADTKVEDIVMLLKNIDEILCL
ncbi:MAG: alanine--glyoxylate aminotransferase family protein [Tissierellia bacterium]|nr:alanine--glyoxylate aminotransferase family protein [Tissierellia bacterium]